MPAYPDEETTLLGGGGKSKREVAKYSVNIEWFRFWGLLGGAVLLLTGRFFTKHYTTIPEEYSAYYDWETNSIDPDAPDDVWGEGSTFKLKQTLIYRLFHFNHTCTVLDFNPSKTIAALIIMFHIIPCNIFVFLDYFRIARDTTLSWGLKTFTKIASPLQFLFIQYFYLVFVNSPYGNANGDSEENKAAMNRFIAHYVPYVLWQSAMLLMGAQQIWYISEKDMAVKMCGFCPKPAKWVMQVYLVYLFVLLVVYTSFVVSFIVSQGQKPLWCTDDSPMASKSCHRGNIMAKVIMYGWDISAVIIPTLFAFTHAMNKDRKSLLEFSELE